MSRTNLFCTLEHHCTERRIAVCEREVPVAGWVGLKIGDFCVQRNGLREEFDSA